MVFWKKNKILDLTTNYKRNISPPSSPPFSNTSSSNSVPPSGFGSFFNSMESSESSSGSSEGYADFSNMNQVSESSDEKRKKLAKRLMDMTAKLEDISNQIYHLQQRIEVLERKSNVSGF